MSIFVKSVLPLMLLALFVLGCDTSQQARPGSKPSQPTPPTQEELEQQKKNVVEAHVKFRSLLSNSLPDTFPIRTIVNGVDSSASANLKKAENFLAKLDTLDASNCPKDYRDPYNELKNAWEKFFQLLVRNKGDLKRGGGPVEVPGGVFRADEFSRFHQDILTNDPDYSEALENIRTKTEDFSKVAAKYGFIL